MRPGWTYLLEAVYSDNTLVISYAFEGLVLLTAVAPDGCELRGVAERQQLAAQLGVVAVPCLQVRVVFVQKKVVQEISCTDWRL